MATAKATVRRLIRPMFLPGQRTGNKNRMNRRQSMFKIKTLLPQIKQVEVGQVENGQVVRRIIVTRKSHYFSANRRLRF